MRAVKKALDVGAIRKKKTCQEARCKAPAIQAHHYINYEPDHWLDVIWYCREHHHKNHITTNVNLRNHVIYQLFHENQVARETLEWMFKLKLSTINIIIQDKNNKIIKASAKSPKG